MILLGIIHWNSTTGHINPHQLHAIGGTPPTEVSAAVQIMSNTIDKAGVWTTLCCELTITSPQRSDYHYQIAKLETFIYNRDSGQLIRRMEHAPRSIPDNVNNCYVLAELAPQDEVNRNGGKLEIKVEMEVSRRMIYKCTQREINGHEYMDIERDDRC